MKMTIDLGKTVYQLAGEIEFGRVVEKQGVKTLLIAIENPSNMDTVKLYLDRRSIDKIKQKIAQLDSQITQ